MQTRLIWALGLLLASLPAAARADTFTIGALGDSLTDPYARYTGNHPITGLPLWGSGGDRNWVEQLQVLRPTQSNVLNHARAGATSMDLIALGQHTALAEQVNRGKVGHAVVMVGANDMLFAMQSDIAPQSVIQDLAKNLNTALSTLRAAGPAAVVVANIPDLTLAPAMQAMLSDNAEAKAMVRGMVQAANREIGRVAAAHGAPVVDLFRLSDLAANPPALSGTQLNSSDFFTPDLFHPSTIPQGLIANTILEAFHRGYGSDVSALRLSNEEILRLAGRPHGPSQTFFDVSPYVDVTHKAPEPSTLVLCLAAGVVGLARFRRRRAA